MGLETQGCSVGWSPSPTFLSPSSIYIHSASEGEKAPGTLQLGPQGAWTSPREILLDGGGGVRRAAFTQGLLSSFKGTSLIISEALDS